MILMLNAEPWSCGLWNYEEDVEIDLEQTSLSKETIIALNNWRNQYEPYTSMQGVKDLNVVSNVDELDSKGVMFIKQIASEYSKGNIEKYYYYSTFKDELLYVLYSNGDEKYL